MDANLASPAIWRCQQDCKESEHRDELTARSGDMLQLQPVINATGPMRRASMHSQSTHKTIQTLLADTVSCDRHGLITQAGEPEQSNHLRHQLQCTMPGDTRAEMSNMLSVGALAIHDGVVHQKAQHANSI